MSRHKKWWKKWKRRPITGFVPSREDELEVLQAGREISLEDWMTDPFELHFRSIMREIKREKTAAT